MTRVGGTQVADQYAVGPDRFAAAREEVVVGREVDGQTGERLGNPLRRARSDDAPELLDIWLRSVRATHAFPTVADISFLQPRVRDYLASDASELYVVCTDAGAVAGFMGRSPRSSAELTVDVNEQNTGARRFYEASGFVVEGRSELDGQGLPFPLLHMRSRAVA
jgi:putative acetyltransferase